MTTHLILVGGFLGAGKTTLLLQAARRLAAGGRQVGIVTNDQGDGLVDTALAHHAQIPVVEVAGGCFCCRFPDLMAALRRLQESVAPDVILAEPVGSCTDLLSTVVRPLHYYYADDFTVAPLTVLVDPGRQAAALPASMRYLHQKQMEEAEIIALNKIDLLAPAAQEAALAALRKEQPEATVLALSAQTGTGLDAWLAQMMATTSQALRSLDLDYGRYAEAEADLGWLNARGTLRAAAPFAADGWLQTLLHTLDQSFTHQGAPIAHIKAHVVTPAATLKASLTGSAGISWDPYAPGVEATRAQFLLNVRVQAAPESLERTVRQALDKLQPASGFAYDLTHFECFSPAPPNPTHRL